MLWTIIKRQVSTISYTPSTIIHNHNYSPTTCQPESNFDQPCAVCLGDRGLLAAQVTWWLIIVDDSDHGRSWSMVVMVVDGGWRWLMVIDGEYSWLTMINGGCWWLMVIVGSVLVRLLALFVMSLTRTGCISEYYSEKEEGSSPMWIEFQKRLPGHLGWKSLFYDWVSVHRCSKKKHFWDHWSSHAINMKCTNVWDHIFECISGIIDYHSL